jgi:hypothetical protein
MKAMAIQSGTVDRHNGRHPDPEILALFARAEAAVLRSRELTATLNDLSRAFADAVQRTDEWLAASKLDKKRCHVSKGYS